MLPVLTTYDQATGRSSRAPDLGPNTAGGTFLYHPSEELALVLTPAELSGFRELTTIAQLEDLRAEWNDSFELEYVSEVTGIGWEK